MANSGKLQGHRLVVLGSAEEFVKLVKMAREQGCYVIACDGYHEGPAKAFANAAYDIDVRDVDAVARMCVEERADGIIASFSDLLAECLVSIAHKAGLKAYCTPDQIRYLRDKPLMKRMFAELGIPTPQTVAVHRESIAQDIAPIGFPCVVKPANGYGSRGVYVLDNAEQVARVFDEVVGYSSFDYLLAEQYCEGAEINAMSWIVDGEPMPLDFADREKTNEIPHAVPHVSRIVYPSFYTDAVYEEARGIMRSIARYIGLNEGPLSLQFFYSPERGIHVCEAAGRLLGYEHELLEYACGFTMEELLLDYVYDEDALRRKLAAHSPNLPKCAAGLYFHGYERELKETRGLAEVRALPGVMDVKEYYEPGQTVSHGVGAMPYVARVYVKGDTRAQVDALSQQVIDTVDAVDDKGESLLYRSELPSYPTLG